MSGTDVAHATISLRASYAMSGTDAAYGATRRGTVQPHPRRRDRRSRRIPVRTTLLRNLLICCEICKSTPKPAVKSADLMQNLPIYCEINDGSAKHAD
eukprot:592523-Rhodomonas_salina.1